MTFRYACTIAMKELVTATFAVEHLLRGFERTVTQVTNTGVGRLLCVCLFRHDSTNLVLL